MKRSPRIGGLVKISSVLALAIVLLSTTSNVHAVDLPPGDDAKVTRIVSGDTIEVTIKGIGFTIGYLGVAAAKGSDCYSQQASAYNSRLVSGKTVRVERDVSDFDGSGRLLRWVWLTDGRLLNEELVRLGYVRASNAAPDRKYRERLLAAEKVAQDAKYGLWRACPQTATPSTALASLVSCPSPQVCITAPASGTKVSPGSMVVFKGSATDPNFARYQFLLGNGLVWGHIADFNRPVANGALMGFQTSSVPPGNYIIRLQVIDKAGNIRAEKADIDLSIASDGIVLAPPSEPLPSSQAENPGGGGACCKICTTGKACGNTCISRRYTCRVGPGCAC